MWQRIFEYGKQLVGLTRKIEQHDEDVQKLRQDLTLLEEKVDRLADSLNSLWMAIQRDRENAAHEREKLVLRLENTLLRLERRLPPGHTDDGP